MKYTLIINQPKAIELGITNINQAHIYDLLTSVSTWAEPEIINGEVFYWVARQTIANELILLNLKLDTVYRHLRSLSKLGLIEYRKIGKKDCIRITQKGKSYLSKNDENDYVGFKSEFKQNSEINPSKLGNKSEKNSEINPTYPSTIFNHTTNYQEKRREDFNNFRKEFIEIYSKEHFYVDGFGFDSVPLVINLDGLILNADNFRFLPSSVAHKIWQHLYENRNSEILKKIS